MAGVGVSSGLAPGDGQIRLVEMRVSLDLSGSVPALPGKHGGPPGACAERAWREVPNREPQDPSCVSLPTHAGWLGFLTVCTLRPFQSPVQGPLEQPYSRTRCWVSCAHLSAHTDWSMYTRRLSCLPATELSSLFDMGLRVTWGSGFSEIQ